MDGRMDGLFCRDRLTLQNSLGFTFRSSHDCMWSQAHWNIKILENNPTKWLYNEKLFLGKPFASNSWCLRKQNWNCLKTTWIKNHFPIYFPNFFLFLLLSRFLSKIPEVLNDSFSLHWRVFADSSAEKDMNEI